MNDANASEWNWRQAQWERLLKCLDEANAIQQRLLGDDDQELCYELHSQLDNLYEEFEGLAAADEQYWTEKEVDKSE
jgi:hypothetical protein